MILLTTAVAFALTSPQGRAVEATPRQLLDAHRAADEALVAGHWEDARTEFLRALPMSPKNATLAYGLACAAARLDRPKEALRWLDAAFVWDYRDVAVARWDADLASIRDQGEHGPRFEAILSGTVEEADASPRGESRADPFPPWNLSGVPEVPMSIRMSPHGECIALASEKGRLQIIDGHSGTLRVEWNCKAGTPRALAFSQEGDVLACLHGDGTLTRWDSSTGEQLSLTTGGLSSPMEGEPRLDFIDSGRRIVGAWFDGGSLWNAEGATVRALPPMGALGAGTRVAWSVGGSRIALMHHEHVELLETGSGSTVFPAFRVEEGVLGLGLSPDGARIAIGSTNGRLQVFDTTSGEQLWEACAKDNMSGTGIGFFDGEPLQVPTLTFSPTGDALAVCTSPHFFLHVFDARSGDVRWSTGHLGGRPGARPPLVFGEHHVLLERGLKVFDVTTGTPREPGPFRWGPSQLDSGGRTLVKRGPGYGLFDAETMTELYRRFEVSRGEVILLHGSGWFAGNILRPTSIRFQEGLTRRTRSVPLEVRCFDPKRLRASQAGVPLLPAPLGAER